MDAAPGIAWTTSVVAFVAAVPLWRFTEHTITIAHEGGHALFGFLLGRSIKAIKLNSDKSGVTLSSGAGAIGLFISGLAGYLGPSIFGFAGAMMLVHDFAPRSVLLLSIAFLVGVLIMTRNIFGLFSVLATGAVLWTVAMRSEPTVQMVFAYIWVWFLLMGGARQIPDLFRVIASGSTANDAAILQRQTHIGDVVWLFVFWLGSVAALVWGGTLLLRHTS